MMHTQPRFAEIVGCLRRWQRRRRLVTSVEWAAWSAVAGLSIGVLLLLAGRIVPLLPSRFLVVGGLVTAALTATVGGLAAWLWPTTLHEVARHFDRALGLDERLITAVEIHAGEAIGLSRSRTGSAMVHDQLVDAVMALRQIEASQAVPMRPRGWGLLAAGLLVLALLGGGLWLPNPQDRVLRQRAAVQEATTAQREALTAMEKRLEEAEGLSETDRQAMMAALAAARQRLAEKPSSASEAVQALAEAERALAPLQDPGAQAVGEGLRRVAASMEDSELTRSIGQALQSGDYEAASAGLRSFTPTQGQRLTRQQEQELARELAEAATLLADSDPALAQELQRASDALMRGEFDEAREALSSAADRLDASGQRVERQEAVEETLAGLQEGRQAVSEAAGEGADGVGEVAGGGTEPVSGSTDADAGGTEQGGDQGSPTAGQGSDGPAAPGGAGHSEDSGSGPAYGEITLPERIGDHDNVVTLPGGEGAEGGPSGGSVPLPPPDSSGATVPYAEVYAEYEREAGLALESSYIPLGMKAVVRDYFSALAPTAEEDR